jgi:Uma2 family endonuclease
MTQVKLGPRTLDLPYTVRMPDVTEEMFDEMVDEDVKAELIDGVMIVHSPASLRHEAIAGFVSGLMGFFADAKELGTVIPAGNGIIHLATCRKFAPDGFLIRTPRVPIPLPKEFEGAPDLVVEVLSPSNRNYDLEDKRLAYQEAGVGEIWFVDEEQQQVTVDRKQRRRYVEQIVTKGKVFSTVLTGFWIDVSWLWADPLPNKMTCLKKILRTR